MIFDNMLFSGSLILIATGSPSDKCQVVNVNSSSTCSNLPSHPMGSMYRASGGVVNGSPTICGGQRANSPYDNTDACYSFDKSTGSWKLHCSMKSKRWLHATTSVKDGLLITGGRHDNVVLASSEYIYDNGTVESGTDLPEGRWSHCTVTLHDGKVMIMGGHLSHLYKSVIIFNPVDKTYTNGPSLNYMRVYAACTIFNSPLHNGRPVVLAAGGASTIQAEVYDYTNTNEWETSIDLIMSNI